MIEASNGAATLKHHPAGMSVSGFVGFLNSSFREQEAESAVHKIPYSWRLLSQFASFTENPLQTLLDIEKQHGPVCKFRAPNNQLFFLVSDPQIIKAILQHTDRGSKDYFDKSPVLADGGGKLLGKDNILVVSNQDWREQHRVISTFFSRGRFETEEVVDKVDEAVHKAVDCLCRRIQEAPSGALKVDLQEETALIALRVALECILGAKNVSDEELVRIRDASRVYHSTIPSEAATPFDLPHKLLAHFSKGSAEVAKSMEILSGFVDRVINECDPTADNIVSDLVRASNMSTPVLTKEQVKHNIMAFLFAGHESTGNILAYSLGQCALHEEYRQAVREEFSKERTSRPTKLSELNRELPFTASIIEEALRFHPPVYLLNRTATEDFKVGSGDQEIKIPAGTEVFMNIYSAHRYESMYGAGATGYPADIFEPRRWQNLEHQIDLLSFGHGPRVCVGMHLFRTEALIVLPCFNERIHVQPGFDNVDNNPASDFTLQKKDGYPAVLTLKSSC